MKKTGYRLLGLSALAALVVSVGCSSSPTPVVDTEYQNCVLGDACTGDTDCETTEFTSGVGTGAMCTAACTEGSGCPTDSGFALIDCVINSGDSSGQCYIDCTAGGDADCEDGTTCAALDGVSICVP